MYVSKSLEGSGAAGYGFGPVDVAESKFSGVQNARLTGHTICFYADEDSYSREVWEGKAELRKHWQRGSVGFMPAGSEITTTPERPYREIAIRFNSDLFAKAIGAEVDQGKIDYRFADVTDPTTSGLSSVLHHMASTGGSAQWPMLIETTAMALAVAVTRQLSPALDANLRKEQPLCGSRQQRVCDYIEANLHRHISLAELADVVARSQYHFSRQFHAKLGLSPMRYIMHRRVELAKVQLLRPDATIVGVAHSCGFGGQSHFTTTFKTIVGITPGEYRKQIRNAA